MSGCLLKRASSKSLTKKYSDAHPPRILHLPHYSRSKQYFRTDLDILPAPIIPTLAKWLLVTAGICCSCPDSPDIASKTSTRVFGSTVCLLVWTMNYTKQKIAPSCMDLACCFSEVLHWPQQKRGILEETHLPLKSVWLEHINQTNGNKLSRNKCFQPSESFAGCNADDDSCFGVTYLDTTTLKGCTWVEACSSWAPRRH